MNRYQQELCMNLSELLTDNYALLNEVIEEYVTLLGNTNRMHDLHEYTSKELYNDRWVYIIITEYEVSLTSPLNSAIIKM